MRITHLIAAACYWTGVDALFYRLNRKAKRIVTFHNVLPDRLWQGGGANGVSNCLKDFETIIARCAKRFRFSTDLFDAKTMTVTFDDGYHNQFAFAFKSLREKGIPACIFVSGDVGRNAGGLLVDKLLHWVAYAPDELIPGGDRTRYWVREVWPRFVADRASRGETVFRELDAKFPYAKIEAGMSEEYRRERLGGISDEELDEMRRAGWKVGWHTKSHYPLIGLSRDELCAELDCPDAFKGVCLSYPYGNPVEVGETAVRLAEELGYPCAVSNCNASEWNAASPFFLPRLALGADRYDFHFELSGAKFFLKFRRLLPRVHPTFNLRLSTML